MISTGLHTFFFLFKLILLPVFCIWKMCDWESSCFPNEEQNIPQNRHLTRTTNSCGILTKGWAFSVLFSLVPFKMVSTCWRKATCNPPPQCSLLNNVGLIDKGSLSCFRCRLSSTSLTTPLYSRWVMVGHPFQNAFCPLLEEIRMYICIFDGRCWFKVPPRFLSRMIVNKENVIPYPIEDTVLTPVVCACIVWGGVPKAATCVRPAVVLGGVLYTQAAADPAHPSLVKPSF